jgi:integrase
MNTHRPQTLTLEDLIARVQSDADLPADKARNVVSSIRTFIKVVGCTPQAEASFQVSRKCINRANPLSHGVSARHWANVRSNLKFALNRYNAATRAPLRQDLSSNWAALRDAIDGDITLVRGLSNFMHWANAGGVMPGAISDAVLEHYLVHLRESTLIAKPEARHRTVTRLWNKASAEIGIWPEVMLSVPDRRRLIRIHLQDFPGSFRDDLDAYCRFMAGEDLFAEHAPSQPRRPSTLKHHRGQFHRLASALVHTGFPIDDVAGLAVLVEKPYLENALKYYAEWLGGQDAPSLRELLGTMIVLARDYVRLENERVDAIKKMLHRLRRRPRGMTVKNRERLRPLLDPLNQRRFLHLADRLIKRSEKLTPMRAALTVQRALAHDLLTVAPMRFANLVGLHLERHFRFIGKGTNRRVIIVISPDEVKNNELLEFELPAHVINLLDSYLEQHRPLLFDGADPGWLFPGRDGKHKHEVGLRDQLMKAVADHAGLTINPHLYRHIAAFFYLQTHPGEYETVRRLLAHASVDTTITFYAEFEGLAARRLYTEHLLQRRTESWTPTDGPKL